MSRHVGNEIDEFVTDALRNNLLGLPLDLAALNMARGRDTGMPRSTRPARSSTTTPATRRPEALHELGRLRAAPQEPASIINFIAAYGTHATITAATTLDGKRAAATRWCWVDVRPMGDGVAEPRRPTGSTS